MIKTQYTPTKLGSRLRHNMFMSFVDEHNKKYPQDEIIYTNDRRIPLKINDEQNQENMHNDDDKENVQNEENVQNDENAVLF